MNRLAAVLAASCLAASAALACEPTPAGYSGPDIVLLHTEQAVRIGYAAAGLAAVATLALAAWMRRVPAVVVVVGVVVAVQTSSVAAAMGRVESDCNASRVTDAWLMIGAVAVAAAVDAWWTRQRSAATPGG